MTNLIAAAGWAENYAKQADNGLPWTWVIVAGWAAIGIVFVVALFVARIRRLSRLPNA